MSGGAGAPREPVSSPYCYGTFYCGGDHCCAETQSHSEGLHPPSSMTLVAAQMGYLAGKAERLTPGDFDGARAAVRVAMDEEDQ